MTNSRILTGDCIEEMSFLESASVDLVLSDPPFSSGTRREGNKGIRKAMTRGGDDDQWFASDSLTTNGLVWLLRSCALHWHRLLKDGGHALIFIDWRMMPAVAAAIESADLRHLGVIVWDKTYFGMGACFRNQHEFILHFTKGMGSQPLRRDVGNVIQCKPIRNGDHPTQKPVPLLKTMIEVVCPEDGLILDCFNGSGSTGQAAAETGRRFIGIERDPKFYEMAASKIESKIVGGGA